MMVTPQSNPTGLEGLDFVVWSTPDPGTLDALFQGFGFSRLHAHRDRRLVHYRQGGMHFLLDREAEGFAADFAAAHGPSICAMGWRVRDAAAALEAAVARGATAWGGPSPLPGVPAILGIGGSLILFTEGDATGDPKALADFEPLDEPVHIEAKGFYAIDHLTNNVEQGQMARWVSFYKEVFGFTEVRTFDIRGEKTGLTSYALRSPCGTFCIPINEATENRSQIQEYIDRYDGAGIQHLAFLTDDLLASLDALQGSDIATLDIDSQYYEEVFDRVPGVREDHGRIRDLQVLVDGDPEGYLLQIFTVDLVGPIFIEMIQRENHLSFGEGNFGALFRSIERDQERRGVI